MALAQQRYSEFYRSSAYAAFPRRERSGGRFRTDAMIVHQEAHENVDPATSELVIGVTLSGATPARWKVGSTWREIEARLPGCIGVSPIGEALEMSVTEDHELLVIALSEAAIADLKADYVPDCVDILNQGHRKYHYDQETARRAHAVWSALSSTDTISSLLADAEVQALLASTLRMIAGQSPDTRRTDGRVDIASLEDYVRSRISDRVSVDDLAGISGLKPTRLNETFKRQTGQTPYAFVRSVRMRMATEALLAGKEPLASIAYRLGFADQAHFSREVKLHTGVSPSKYRA